MKRFILKLVMAIIIVITFISCTKIGKNMTVKGRVLNPITGEGYAGVEIKLLRSKNLQYNGGYKAIQKVVSDENGNYEISAMRIGTIYLISGEKGDNYSLGFNHDGKYYSMLKVDKGKTMHVDYHLVPYTHLKLKINNISCNTDDKFILYMKNQITSIDSTYGWEMNGCVNWETNGYSQIPMGIIYYHWQVTKNGITQNFYDTIFHEANQYETYEINY